MAGASQWELSGTEWRGIHQSEGAQAAASARLPEVFAAGDRDRAGQRQIEVVGLTKGQESRDGEAKALIESHGNHDGLSQHRASEQARSCAAKTLAATR